MSQILHCMSCKMDIHEDKFEVNGDILHGISICDECIENVCFEWITTKFEETRRVGQGQRGAANIAEALERHKEAVGI